MLFGKDIQDHLLHAGVILTGLGTVVVVYTVYKWRLDEASVRTEIAQLRRDVCELKEGIPKTLDDIRSTLQDLKESIQNRSSSRSNASFRTAWSDDEDYLTRDFVTSVTESLSATVEPFQDLTEKEAKLNQTMNRVDGLNDGNEDDKDRAMKLLLDNEMEMGTDWRFLWRLGRAHVGAYTAGTLPEQKKTHAEAALASLNAALDINYESAEIHKWYAISLGAMTDFISTKEKIENGYKLRKHVEKALELAPDEPTLYFMMGRWCWGVYMLTWIERKVASTLFATPPTATLDQALQNFLKAEQISKGFYKNNQLYIGKCYYEMKNFKQAKYWFESARAIPTITTDDEASHAEVIQLLEKL